MLIMPQHDIPLPHDAPPKNEHPPVLESSVAAESAPASADDEFLFDDEPHAMASVRASDAPSHLRIEFICDDLPARESESARTLTRPERAAPDDCTKNCHVESPGKTACAAHLNAGSNRSSEGPATV
jgi:hypothetical protein